MKRIIASFGEPLIGCDRKEDVRSFHADLELEKIVVLENLGVIECAFHHRFGTRLTVALQQLFLQRARVHADAHGHAVIFRGLHHISHTLRRTDVAGIDAQTCRPRLCRLDGPLVVEVDVGHDRHIGCPDNRLQRLRCILVRT